MIVRSADPQVLEHPFSELQKVITPTEEFYVRDHFSQPTIDTESYRLRIDGCVSQPMELTYDDIVSMPSRTVAATLECAGNSRSFVVPPLSGVQWGLGGVGNAEWTGVPLKAVLAMAKLRDSAFHIIFEGADSGVVNPEAGPCPVGPIHFARSLPLEKALQDNILLVHSMNGQPLTKAHGFPLRLIVPGWYAVASVKWLNRIIVIDHVYNGYFQTVDYGYWEEEHGDMVRVPLTRLRTKAEIARPKPNEVLKIDQDCEIFGACWSGESDIAQVEISVDGGSNWKVATLLGDSLKNAWRLWKYDWHTPKWPQKTVLVARAT